MPYAVRAAMRQAITAQKHFSNPGLAFSRSLLVSGEQNHDASHSLLQAISNSSASPAYAAAYRRWVRLAEAQGFALVEMELTGPLAVGLGNESGMEVGITTNRTYGMPVIPGSAVKGLCHRTARLEIAMDEKARTVLFGEVENAACCTWHDAWYNPSSLQGKPYQLDTITVHHPKYYQNHNEWPTDFDDPTPVPFLSVRPEARFTFAIDVHAAEAVREGWTDLARAFLEWCLPRYGIGGKTNAGYGRFRGVGIPRKGIGTQGEQEDWSGVHVTYTPGNGLLAASVAGKPNRATGQIGDVAMPDDLRNLIKNKKSAAGLTAKVSVLGNQAVLVSLTRA